MSVEDVPKGKGDRPVEDVVIVDCGEVRAMDFCLLLLFLIFFPFNQLPVETEVDAEGNQVPLHAEL
jgi:peptidyl-prolyl cis-trans isomerase B (cyclophilin B)